MFNRFGTTSDMIIQTVEEQGVPLCLAIDGQGLYLTMQSRIDSGMADNNRYAGNRQSMHARISALGLDPEHILNENKHRVQTKSGGTAQKVNPLKASKRQSKR